MSIKAQINRRAAQQGGFTLLEAIIMTTILSIVAVAASVGLQSLVKVPKQNDNQLVISNQLVDRMEQLRGTPFANLASGSAGNISWTVTTVDPTGGGSPKADFKQITVTQSGRSISCYVTQP